MISKTPPAVKRKRARQFAEFQTLVEGYGWKVHPGNPWKWCFPKVWKNQVGGSYGAGGGNLGVGSGIGRMPRDIRTYGFTIRWFRRGQWFLSQHTSAYDREGSVVRKGSGLEGLAGVLMEIAITEEGG